MNHSFRRGTAWRHAVLLMPLVALAFFMMQKEEANADVTFIHTFERQNSSPNFSVFQEGEELVYEVSYLSIKLGAVIAKVVDVDTQSGRIAYKTECLMRSYKGVPFVTLHTIFQSTLSDSLASQSFSTREHISDTLNKYIHYSFPRKKNVVHISERIGNKPVPENYDTLSLDGKRWQDGLSLLYYARANSHRRFVDRVPVLIYRTKATTTIQFGVEQEDIEIDAVDYPIHAVKLDGETGFTGIFGLTGDFEGWFSADDASIPLYAKMHVIIGSVRLELVKWKRKGWKPPPWKERG